MEENASKEKKGLGFYFEIIKIPLIVMIVWSLAVLIASLNLPQQLTIIVSLVSWLVIILIYGWTGFMTTRKVTDGEGGFGARAGAMLGVVSGFILALVSIVIFFGFPAVFNPLIERTMKTVEEAGQTISKEMLVTGMQISTAAGIIVNPLLYGLVGALFSGVAALIFRKK